MSGRRWAWTLAIVATLIAMTTPAIADPGDPVTTGSTTDGGLQVGRAGPGAGAASASTENDGTHYAYLDCGRPTKSVNLTGDGLQGLCGQVRYRCAIVADGMSAQELAKVTMAATVATPVGGDPYIFTVSCAVRAGRPVVSAAMARAQMVRLLPHPGIGVAPVDRVTLVHIDTILWVATTPRLDLGTATLLGQRVSLRAHVVGVQWSFGDGTTTRSAGPGKAYSDADPCRTLRCPDYFTHVYETTGRPRVGAGVVWSGEFRVGSGTWQQIPQSVTVAAQPLTLRVREARAVLVPNP